MMAHQAFMGDLKQKVFNKRERMNRSVLNSYDFGAKGLSGLGNQQLHLNTQSSNDFIASNNRQSRRVLADNLRSMNLNNSIRQ